MRLAHRLVFVFASLAALLVPIRARADFMKTLDRRFPTEYCPIDNDDNDLTFTAASDRVTIRVQANNFSGSSWNANRLDNFTIVPKATFDAHRIVTPNYGICFVDPPGPANYPGYDFSAAGTTETFFDQFDTNAAAWDLTNHAWWDNVDFHASAPHSSSANPNDFSGGALALGRQEDGAIQAQSDVTVTGLTPGTLYVITGWWSTQNLNTLTFTIITNPCHDNDGDGVTDCAGDCNDADPKIHPGAAEVCDGRDNDCNGLIDDNAACVKVCSTPSKIGSDLRVTNAQFDSSHASIAWNGVDYGMVWHDSRNGDQEIWFTHITPAGVKVAPEVSVTGSCSDCTNPRVVWNGSEYGAVWSHNGAISFRRFDRNGTPIGTEVPLLDPANGGTSPDEPDLVWTGSEYGVVWDQFVNQQQIRFVRIDRTGNTLSQYIHVTDDTSFNGNSLPRIAWSGSKYGIAWRGNGSGQSQIFFELVDPRQGPTLPATQVTTHTSGVNVPTVASNGSEFGVAWEDFQTFAEIYYQRISAAGARVGNPVRITNAAGISSDPSIAWTGSEYGVVWDDDRTSSGNPEIWFTRISSAGAKIGSDIQLTTLGDQSVSPSLGWGGGKYGVAWSDTSNLTGDVEIYFLREGCNCVDADGDGQSSCVDCDDTRATVFGGATQLCGDGLNNDCNSASWPLLAGTNEADNDGDGFSVCMNDCNDANATIWATPGEVRLLMATSKTTFIWSAPSAPGAASLLYDTLRSPTPTNFTTSATCVETNDGPNTTFTDATNPAVGAGLYYLVRAEDACPSGQGPLGFSTAGVIAGRTCP
ncbi:MAG TPA: putative metal-binding motif-containing protein [Candidatus Polarisedimenticolaceae bacterium]|nr:putative metal-binding motif-containing protein [Candidatus Polarisedimenticolaceae bacterium]